MYGISVPLLSNQKRVIGKAAPEMTPPSRSPRDSCFRFTTLSLQRLIPSLSQFDPKGGSLMMTIVVLSNVRLTWKACQNDVPKSGRFYLGPCCTPPVDTVALTAEPCNLVYADVFVGADVTVLSNVFFAWRGCQVDRWDHTRMSEQACTQIYTCKHA